ncbi:MAG: hypothetical protein KGI80_05150 [Verrucomicrobiota bacterium]|nr:hypothetical protein [Verrucomicrobiota bacterium]
MCKLAFIRKFFFILAIPSIIFPSEPQLYERQETSVQSTQSPVSYDDILELLEEIESGSIYDCNAEQAEQVNKLLAILAKNGILPHEEHQVSPLINRDIQSLLNLSSGQFVESDYFLSEIYEIAPAIYYHDFHNHEFDLCRSWGKRAWDKTRHFVKKHKKEILIGAAVTVAVAVTVTAVVLTCGAASGGAVALAEGAIAAAKSEDEKASSKSSEHPPSQPLAGPSETQKDYAPPIAIAEPAPSQLQTVIEEQVSSFKEIISENLVNQETRLAPTESSSFLTQVRAAGSYIAHETLDLVANIASEIPRLREEIRGLAERFATPDSQLMSASSVKDFEDRVASGHEFIDKVFNTEQARFYTSEAKESSVENLFSYAVLPPPGALSGTAAVGDGRLLATQCNSTWGWKVGDSIQNRTWWGGVPKWTTVRQRYWKNMALKAESNPVAHGYRPEDIPLMQKGLAPRNFNNETCCWESKELHHVPPQREGGLFDFIEVWPDEHANLDPNRYLGR